MEKLVELIGKKGVPELVSIPDAAVCSLHQCKKNPQLIIETLQSADGDVEEYVNQFRASDHKSKITVLTNTFLILNSLGNEALKAQWDALIAAYKAAKVSIAERAAFHWIGNYTPPTGKVKVPMNTAVMYMRTWMGEHMSSETTKGRVKAMEPPPPRDNAASAILSQLQSEDEEQ